VQKSFPGSPQDSRVRFGTLLAPHSAFAAFLPVFSLFLRAQLLLSLNLLHLTAVVWVVQVLRSSEALAKELSWVAPGFQGAFWSCFASFLNTCCFFPCLFSLCAYIIALY